MLTLSELTISLHSRRAITTHFGRFIFSNQNCCGTVLIMCTYHQAVIMSSNNPNSAGIFDCYRQTAPNTSASRNKARIDFNNAATPYRGVGNNAQTCDGRGSNQHTWLQGNPNTSQDRSVDWADYCRRGDIRERNPVWGGMKRIRWLGWGPERATRPSNKPRLQGNGN